MNEKVTDNHSSTQPAGWIPVEALEVLSQPEMNWMPLWNRPNGAQPVALYAVQESELIASMKSEIADLRLVIRRHSRIDNILRVAILIVLAITLAGCLEQPTRSSDRIFSDCVYQLARSGPVSGDAVAQCGKFAKSCVGDQSDN